MPKSSSPPRRPPASDPKTARQQELTTKRRGELSELAFAHNAASLGFGVAKPLGDSERFDFILVSRDWPEGEKLWRVQVKCTASLINGFYHVSPARHSCGSVIPYKPTEVDFVIVHIIPDDSYFIFPIRDTPTCLALRPKSHRRGIHEPYREAWHLLRPPKNV
jgi:hypothetical protein